MADNFDKRRGAAENEMAMKAARTFEARATGVKEFARWVATRLNHKDKEAYAVELAQGSVMDKDFTATIARAKLDLQVGGIIQDELALRAELDKHIAIATNAKVPNALPKRSL